MEPELNAVTVDGQVRRLGPTLMALWVALVSRGGRLVTKEELILAVWQDRCVSDEAVTVAVYELRKLLGDQARAPRYIETIPGKGYRWLPEVEWAAASDESVPDEHTSAGFDGNDEQDHVEEDGQPSLHDSAAVERPRRFSARTLGWVALLLVAGLVWMVARSVEEDGPRVRSEEEGHLVLRNSASDRFRGGSNGVLIPEVPIPEVPIPEVPGTYRSSTCKREFHWTASSATDISSEGGASIVSASTSDPRYLGALRAAGLVDVLRLADRQKLAQHLEGAVAAGSGSSLDWQGLAWIHLAQGRLEEARRAAERGVEMDPHSSSALHALAMADFAAGQPRRGLGRLALGVGDECLLGYEVLALKVALLAHLGDHDQAWLAYVEMLEAVGYDPIEVQRLFAVHLREGFEGVVRYRLRAVPEMPRFWQALQWMWLGEEAAALEALVEGALRREPEMILLAAHPGFDRLHGNPRFEALIERLGLVKP